jgi:hypothetical protein
MQPRTFAARELSVLYDIKYLFERSQADGRL